MEQNNEVSHHDLDKKHIEKITDEIEKIDFESQLDAFKAIVNENRLKIIYVLNLVEELCVHDIAAAVGITVANASYHLQILLKEGIVQNRRDGKHLFYSLKRDKLNEMLDFLHQHSKIKQPVG